MGMRKKSYKIMTTPQHSCNKPSQTGLITQLKRLPFFPFNTTLHLMRWRDSARPFFFSGLNSWVSFHWRLRSRPANHGKAINAADHFVTMYKQRKQISSMSNHIHSLFGLSLDVYKLEAATQ